MSRLSTGLARSLRLIANNVPVLVVAPWLSQRTQELLAEEGFNYIDLTGNARLKLDNPAVFVRSAGATRNPVPEPRARAAVRGLKAARLIRLLADVRPPYGVGEIAAVAGLTPGYVSRLLSSLDREALIERARGGRVVSVDVPPLLRRWAETYDVLETNGAQAFLAPAGAAQALRRLGEIEEPDGIAVTGSFAAVRFAPVAAPTSLLVYCEDEAPVVDALGLIPADEGANVVLLRPFDPVVWDRAAIDGGVAYAAPSQVVADCLTGTGRMPAEGAALLEWMVDSEPRWRLASLSDAGEREGSR